MSAPVIWRKIRKVFESCAERLEALKIRENSVFMNMGNNGRGHRQSLAALPVRGSSTFWRKSSENWRQGTSQRLCFSFLEFISVWLFPLVLFSESTVQVNRPIGWQWLTSAATGIIVVTVSKCAFQYFQARKSLQTIPRRHRIVAHVSFKITSVSLWKFEDL